MFMVSLRLMLG